MAIVIHPYESLASFEGTGLESMNQMPPSMHAHNSLYSAGALFLTLLDCVVRLCRCPAALLYIDWANDWEFGRVHAGRRVR